LGREGAVGGRHPRNEGFCRGGPAWPPWAGEIPDPDQPPPRADMETQNVKLLLPRDLVGKARHVAIERGVSLSELAGSCLEEVVAPEQSYTWFKRA